MEVRTEHDRDPPALDLVFEHLSEGFDVRRGRRVEVGFFGGLGQFAAVGAQHCTRTLFPRSRTRVPNTSSMTGPDSKARM